LLLFRLFSYVILNADFTEYYDGIQGKKRLVISRSLPNDCRYPGTCFRGVDRYCFAAGGVFYYLLRETESLLISKQLWKCNCVNDDDQSPFVFS
jgi:hypothetical protein